MNSLVKLNSNGHHALIAEFPSLFDGFVNRDFFNTTLRRVFRESNVPAVNVKESATAYELSVAAPGLNKKDFKIEINQNTISISAKQEKTQEEKNEDGTYSRKEFSYQSFKREFQLPENLVNDDDIQANYTDGILYIHLPKKELVKPILKEIAVA
jgi:HSP20 family protein